jgi:hypothetical protein
MNHDREPRRIAPTRESLGFMKTMRNQLIILQEQIPEIVGLAFWGSRIVGKEKPGSDLDVVVFYDCSNYLPPDESDRRFFDENGNLKEETRKEYATIQRPKAMAGADLYSNIKSTVEKNMKKNNIPVNDVLAEGVAGDRYVTQAIRKLKKFVDKYTTDGKLDTKELYSPLFCLNSIFLPSVGEEIYMLRSLIFDRLEKMEEQGENGERYFQAMMSCLEDIPREDHKQGTLPKTIADARKYFVCRKLI